MSHSGGVGRKHEEVSDKRVGEEIRVRHKLRIFASFSCCKLGRAFETEGFDYLRHERAHAFLVSY